MSDMSGIDDGTRWTVRRLVWDLPEEVSALLAEPVIVTTSTFRPGPAPVVAIRSKKINRRRGRRLAKVA